MTRICGQCQKYLGEKCPKCGLDVADTQDEIFLHCPNRTHFCGQFRKGAGGVMTGLCDDCLKGTRAELNRPSRLFA